MAVAIEEIMDLIPKVAPSTLVNETRQARRVRLRIQWLQTLEYWELIARKAINRELQGCNVKRTTVFDRQGNSKYVVEVTALGPQFDREGNLLSVTAFVQLTPRKEVMGGYRIPMGREPKRYTLIPVWRQDGSLKTFKVTKGRYRPKCYKPQPINDYEWVDEDDIAPMLNDVTPLRRSFGAIAISMGDIARGSDLLESLKNLIQAQ